MPTYYLDYENGDDSRAGDAWASAWKTITSGATAARIAPGDIIRIAKSPAPYSIGSGSWIDLSKSVYIRDITTLILDNCESHTAWNANPSGDTTLSTIGVATTAKEGSNCVKFLLDSTPQTNTMQAYCTFATSGSDLSSYSKISFWIYNSAAIAGTGANWKLQLCDDISGSSPINTFNIPPILSFSRWVPLTLSSSASALGNNIKSIAVRTGSAAPTASSYIYLDNIMVCGSGLNLQSLISKNSLEQGGDEGWYGIQSINGSTVMLDDETNTKSNAGRGYSGNTETITTYARETIKTITPIGNQNPVQTINDSGTYSSGDIQFQGGYDTSTNLQTGETFFDGLCGWGYGIYAVTKYYITLNMLNLIRYYYGVSLSTCANFYINTLNNLNNNSQYGLYAIYTSNSIIEKINNASNNGGTGLQLALGSSNNTINILNNMNNNLIGLGFSSAMHNNVKNINNANNNSRSGLAFNASEENIIGNILTRENATATVYNQDAGYNYILNANVSEPTKVTHNNASTDSRIFFNNIGGYSLIDCRAGNIVSQNATAGGTGIEWKMSVTNAERISKFPLTLKIAEIACAEGSEVTVACYFKKSHATDIAAALVCSGSQIAGVDTSASVVCPDDTNRNQLSINFTPSGSGVVAIEAWSWWVANTADENVIIDDISVTQA